MASPTSAYAGSAAPLANFRPGESEAHQINTLRVQNMKNVYKCFWVSVIVLAAILPSAKGHALDQRSPQEMAARIDVLLEQRMQELGWEPAGVCDDANFIRRASLDLTGRNPTASDVLGFIQDASPDKRGNLIDRLLASPTCAVHLANTWAAWLLPESVAPQAENGRAGLHTWLRNRFAENLRYDRLVSDLLVATGPANSGPGAFFLSLDGKPERIAAKTSRVFLGIQLDCAECHDHPFDHWKQREFWGFAAYFARLSADPSRMMAGDAEVVDLPEGEVKLPSSDEIVAPQALVQTGLSGLASGTRRQQLTLWLTARENPYLARAAVNRSWSLLFGGGLIEPVDDMRSIEQASHPVILQELADYFAKSGFDLKLLLATLGRTRAYQRASVHAKGHPPAQSYAVMTVKPLTSIQLATCLTQVARQFANEAGDSFVRRLANELGRLRGDASQATLGIVQSLITLHSEQMQPVWSESQSRLLAAITAPHLTSQKQIEFLFLSTLSRLPTDDELRTLLTAAAAKVEDDRRLKATESVSVAATGAGEGVPSQSPVKLPLTAASWQADLLWALINSSEFAMTP